MTPKQLRDSANRPWEEPKALPSLAEAYTAPCLGIRRDDGTIGHRLQLIDGTIAAWGTNGWRGNYACLDCGKSWTKFNAVPGAGPA